MKRREFIGALGAVAVLWPFRTHAQQSERMRRIGVLSNLREDDPEGRARYAVFIEGLQALGWSVGRNLQIEYRWSGGDADRLQADARELVALGPDVIMASSGVTVLPLLQVTRTIPIVFAQTVDPVGAGIVESLSRPGGNVTGFTNVEFGITAKWLDLLRQIAPAVTHAAILRDPFDPAGIGQWGAMQLAAQPFAIELSLVNVRDPDAIERGMMKTAMSSNGGFIVTTSAPSGVNRDLIVRIAAQHRLPGVYPNRSFVAAGGLVSYGPDPIDQYRGVASYIDRILKGERPADLPVQAPTKYGLSINQKTAKALGIAVPETLLAVADEVIER